MTPARAARFAVLMIAAVCIPALPAAAASPVLPPHTTLQVRMKDGLSSDSAKVGDAFHGTLAQPVVVNGKTLFDKGTDVTGQVVLVSKSGRLSSPGQLQLLLTSISTGWFSSAPLAVYPVVLRGGSHRSANLEKIGGSAAAGAVVGGLTAGGKGAAIGAGAGAGAGTVLAAATGKREAVVQSEEVLAWTTVGAAPTASRVPRSSYRSDRDEDDRARSRDRDSSDYAEHSHRGNADQGDEDNDGDRADRDGRFSDHDRIVLRTCFAEGDNYSNLPPGLAKKDRLPPGLERHLERDGTLPPGLEKRVRPLPQSCEIRLPRLPHDWERVILGGRIILLDQTRRILDILDVQDDEDE